MEVGDYMARRHEYFSLEEANAIVPTLEYYFRQLVLLQRDLSQVKRALQNGAGESEQEHYATLCKDYDHVVEEILAQGVEIVDPEAGIVNLYTWCDNEEMVLSWQYGEPAVQYWFDPGEGFHNRRPLRQLFADIPGTHVQRH